MASRKVHAQTSLRLVYAVFDVPSNDPDIERLRRFFAGQEPEGLEPFLSVVEPGRLTFEGTTVPIVGATRIATRGDLLVAEGSREQAEPTAAYLVLTDYLALENEGIEVDVDAFMGMLVADHPQVEMVAQLAILDHLLGQQGSSQELAKRYAEFWQPNVKERLAAALGPSAVPRRAFLARQPILAAIRYVLTRDPPLTPTEHYPSLFAAILLTHAIAVTLEASGEDTGDQIAGHPAYLVLEVVRAAGLYSMVDMYAAIDRVVRLWRVYGTRVTRGGLDRTPAELLVEATGLELEDIVGLGFVLLARRVNGLKGESVFDPDGLRVRMDPNRIGAFLELVSTEPEAIRDALQRSDSRFAFLPFEQTPVLRTERGLLVMDEVALWKRITSGLYWVVHDYIKNVRAPGTDMNLRWNEAYSEMVEMAVEDQLHAMAPPLLGSEGTLFFTEEDLERAYGSGQRADAAVDFGDVLMLTEVVSGQLAVATRIEGSIRKFKDDTSRLVIEKCEQLEAASQAILRDESSLTRSEPVPGRRILPVVVVGGGYPVSRLTMAYIREELERLGILQDPRVMPLAIIDMDELEMLEGLAERGTNPVDVLRAWRESALGEWPFSLYVINTYGPWGPANRPTRMRESVDRTFEDIVDRLKLIPGDGEPTDEQE